MGAASGRRRYFLALLFAALVGAAFWLGLSRLEVRTDLAAALPGGAPAVDSARRLLEQKPLTDSLFIQLSWQGPGSGRDRLVQAAGVLRKRLLASGLVASFPASQAAGALPGFLLGLPERLPALLDREDLERLASKRLALAWLTSRLAEMKESLAGMGGTGRARSYAADPLGLSEAFFERLTLAKPREEMEQYRGELFNKGGRHLLLIAKLSRPGGDTEAGRLLREVLARAGQELSSPRGQAAGLVEMAYSGVARAALDNEEIVRQDMKQALILVTLGLGLLIILCFRRPWIGLLALVPAGAGIMLATFFYSLLHPAIFALSMGFGGALLSVAVDHGLAYVLFLDQGGNHNGKTISREVWKVASFPLVTTVAGLLALTASGVPIFQEVGLFAALGMALSALSVHVMFPLLLPRVAPPRRQPWLPVDRLLSRLGRGAPRAWVWSILLVGLALPFLAWPGFNLDLRTMNTVRPATQRAEEEFARNWGALANQASLAIKAGSLPGLWEMASQWGDFLLAGRERGAVAGPLPPLSLLPSPGRQEANRRAWKDFWTSERRETLRRNLALAAEENGFNLAAFGPFFRQVEHPESVRLNLPAGLLPALGVEPPGSDGSWSWFTPLHPGPNYRAEDFLAQGGRTGAAFFDPGLFTRQLSERLSHSFVWMLCVMGACALLLLYLLFLDTVLVAASALPLVLAIAGTLGFMGLMGIPLTLPSLMLAPVVLGMGMDYGLYLVRARQRYGLGDAAGLAPFRATVLMGGLSTLVGMGSLALSRHVVLQQAGLTTFLGILLAMVGAFLITPSLLNKCFKPWNWRGTRVEPGSQAHRRAALRRYRHLAAHPRVFAACKLAMDPMFPRLKDFFRDGQRVLDIGCGYGTPAVWLGTCYPDLIFHCLEPDPERAMAAARALGDQGEVATLAAPDFPALPAPPDVVMCLDVAHYLSDEQFEVLLASCAGLLPPEGVFLARISLPGGLQAVWQRRLETWRNRLAGRLVHYRSRERIVAALQGAGFGLHLVEPTAPGREETWFLAHKTSPREVS